MIDLPAIMADDAICYLWGLLYQLERGHPVRAHAAEFSVDVGGPDFSFTSAAAVAGYLGVQSRPERVRSPTLPFSMRTVIRYPSNLTS